MLDIQRFIGFDVETLGNCYFLMWILTSTGLLCGACDDKYSLQSDGECTLCKEWSTEAIVALIVVLILILILSTQVRALWTVLSYDSDVRDVGAHTWLYVLTDQETIQHGECGSYGRRGSTRNRPTSGGQNICRHNANRWRVYGDTGSFFPD